MAALGLIALAAGPAPAAARDMPNVGCGGDTVEVCFPVCVTEPCPAYVCVHTDEADICRTL